jgi:hypothetical protein
LLYKLIWEAASFGNWRSRLKKARRMAQSGVFRVVMRDRQTAALSENRLRGD